ncbi:restriction endonuclease subunit S [Acinetobacter schindleri]|uniref:restriction endonuclease subunit S n=1 Tax=Acinetobacter schindleri TaxID=108981 RepID=UPI00404632E6
MQFKQYPSYKPSGVEWLGDVPEHWQQKPIWSLFKRIKRTNFPTERLLSVYRDYGVIPKDSRDDNHNRASEDLTPYQLVCANDLVINKMKAWQGSIAISELRGIVSPAYYIYQPKAEYHSKYIHFLIRSAYYIQSYKNYSKGIRVNQWDLEHEAFTHIDLLLPSLEEQQKIVAFLNTETARIDTLIAKQEKLIELLEEQRKSIISHAVTKGLNPNAPMKDSGVEWLGNVPEHWTVLKNRHIFNFSKGLSITKENLQESGIPCVSYGEVHSKFGFEFNPEINDLKFVSEEYLKTSKNCLLNSGDFIFADTSEDFEGSGNFSYLNSNSQVFAGYHTVIARLKSKQKPRFFAYIFDSNAHRKQIQTQVKGIKVFSITQGILKDIYSWLPPVHEQDLIVEYLDNECKKISLLKAKQIELIEKLKEYRSSIISHAVTGKIDVREFGA